MISVFPKTAITLQELSGVGYPVLDHWCKSWTLHITLNGSQYIKVIIPHKVAAIKKDLLPKEEDILKITDMYDEEDFYRIKTIRNTLKETTYIAEHISYDLLNNFIEDTFIVDKDGQGAMTQLSGATQYPHPFTFRSNIVNRGNIRVVRMNPIQALIGNSENTFLSRLGGEMKRQRFNIWMDKRIGVNRTDTIRSRKNLTGFEREISLDNLVTRIMARGKNGVSLPEKYVDSPLINNYIQPRIKEVTYPVEFEGNFEELPEQEKQRLYAEIRVAAKKDFDDGIDLPKATYKVNFVTLQKTEEYKEYKALEKINIGDTIPVYEETYDIMINAKVTEIEWDGLNQKYLTVTLGNFDSSIVRSNISTNSSISHKVEQVNTTANHILSSANGKNSNYYGPDEPSNSDKGDLWYKENGEEIELWQYQEVNGKLQWVYLTGDRSVNELKERFNEVEAKTEELNQHIAESQERNDSKLKEFREALDSLYPDLTEEINRVRYEINDVSETNIVHAELIGKSGPTRYNKNLLKGEFNRRIPSTDGHITIEANDGGFKRGETYTISFEAICELLAKANLSFNFDKENVRRLSITMTPSDLERLTIVESNGDRVQAHLGEYAVKLVSDWYRTQSSQLNVTGDSTVDVNLEYREIADGNLEMAIQGEWAESPEIILDGGGA